LDGNGKRHSEVFWKNVGNLNTWFVDPIGDYKRRGAYALMISFLTGWSTMRALDECSVLGRDVSTSSFSDET
jgi:hypothetical protein